MSRATRPLFNEMTTSVPEAGRALGLSRNASYEAAKRGEIPTLRFGRRLVVPVAALRRMLALPEALERK
jgi:hypothetical protein